MRGNRESRNVRLTARDRKILTELAAARWLTTSQIANLCFPNVSMEMARRRLRLLGEEGNIFSCQVNRMAEALHSLGSAGKDWLLQKGWKRPIRLERVPPKNLEHFLGVNDIRVAVKRSAERDGIALGFFFASWELQQHGWAFRIIPDAACHVEHAAMRATIAFEYDRGEETIEYIARTKFKTYADGLPGFPVSNVLVIGDAEERLHHLREQAGRNDKPEMFSFLLLDEFKDSLDLMNWLV